MKRGEQFHNKLNIELSYNPAIFLLDVYPQIENRYWNKNLHANIHSNTIHNSQMIETI